jgi:adenylate cyclase
MSSKIVKYVGLSLIIAFSAVSIYLAITEREFLDPSIQKKIAYTTFFEDRFYDFRMRQTLDPNKKDRRVVLVAIDDHSIGKVGKWPFPRDYYAKFMDKLKVFGTKVIAYDVFFSEESLSCPGVSPDKIMADAITNFQSVPGNKVILPYSLSNHPSGTFKELPDVMYEYMIDSKEEEGASLIEKFIETKVFPIDQFVNKSPALAHIQVYPDLDGLIRHYPIVGNVEELYFPGFSLSAYAAYTGDKPKLMTRAFGESSLILKSGEMHLNFRGESKVRWLGSTSNFNVVSFWDVVQAQNNDEKMKEMFENTIVFLGSTAFGAHDLRHTPVDTLMPGVFFHMNMAHMLLDGYFYRHESDSAIMSWSILIIGTFLILLIQIFGNPVLDIASVITISLSLIFYDTYFLTPDGYQVKLFFCLFSIGACYSWNTLLHFYLANKDKQFLKSAFGNYISPELIDEMYSSGEAPKLGGDSGVRTAYFTDIQGFSTFSEKLTATKLVELLNEYLTAMTDILLEEGGTLDKYEGDAIIAFFGAPMPQEDHARRACLVAQRMQESLLELRKKWVSEGDKWPEIVHNMRMRIGINSGEIVTGNMGSASRMNYTMMGDSVNLAARLEESAKQYGMFTHVSKETLELAGDDFLWRELDTIKVMGKTQPVTSFDLLGLNKSASEYLKALSEKFEQALILYKDQQFEEALKLFKFTLELEYQRYPLLKGVKTNPSEIYIKRCEDYLKTPPPPEWDGVYTLTSK